MTNQVKIYPHVVIESGVVVGDNMRYSRILTLGKYKNMMEQKWKII